MELQPMAAIDLARSHVEPCLQDLWSVERVLPDADADGDYCYGSGTAHARSRIVMCRGGSDTCPL